MKKAPKFETVTLEKIVGGGQTLGTLENGQKIFVWGGLPNEKVVAQITKSKSHLAEGVVTEVIEKSPERIEPRDTDSFLSTSPWQIMNFESEQNYKAALIEEAFELHNIVLPDKIEIYSDGNQFEYRNKIEFSWYWDNETNTLELAFFRRGSHGKIPVEITSLANPNISAAAIKIRDLIRTKSNITAWNLKTLLIRANQSGDVAAQLYVKDLGVVEFNDQEIANLDIAGFELIFSNPKSPASVITKRLQTWGDMTLTDQILGVEFSYSVEGFFQINIPVYEQSLRDIKKYVDTAKPLIDLYSGVGSIGLTVTDGPVSMIEINESAVAEMRRNIEKLGRKSAQAILAPSEKALEYIDSSSAIIVDPPRAGLHDDVIEKLLEQKPARIIYLSCNPVTQARDIAKLADKYGIKYHRGYNYFPRTPHIENLIVLDLKAS